jgi:hypothetical protein
MSPGRARALLSLRAAREETARVLSLDAAVHSGGPSPFARQDRRRRQERRRHGPGMLLLAPLGTGARFAVSPTPRAAILTAAASSTPPQPVHRGTGGGNGVGAGGGNGVGAGGGSARGGSGDGSGSKTGNGGIGGLADQQRRRCPEQPAGSPPSGSAAVVDVTLSRQQPLFRPATMSFAATVAAAQATAKLTDDVTVRRSNRQLAPGSIAHWLAGAPESPTAGPPWSPSGVVPEVPLPEVGGGTGEHAELDSDAAAAARSSPSPDLNHHQSPGRAGAGSGTAGAGTAGTASDCASIARKNRCTPSPEALPLDHFLAAEDTARASIEHHNHRASGHSSSSAAAARQSWSPWSPPPPPTPEPRGPTLPPLRSPRHSYVTPRRPQVRLGGQQLQHQQSPPPHRRALWREHEQIARELQSQRARGPMQVDFRGFEEQAARFLRETAPPNGRGGRAVRFVAQG